MKKLLPIILLLSLLAACAPAPMPPTSTAIPTNTNTPKPTTTPLPTLTPTPTLEPWMQSLPENVVSVEQGDDAVVGLDENGKIIMQFDKNSAEWQKVYKNGVDTELQVDVILDAEKIMGMSVNEKIDSVQIDETIFRDETRALYRSEQMYLGYRVLSMSDISGAFRSDRVFISYSVQVGFEDSPIPYIQGYEYQGKFYQTCFVYPSKEGGAPLNKMDDFDSLVRFFEDNIMVGDVFLVTTNTFELDMKPEEWIQLNLDKNRSVFGTRAEEIFKLIDLQDNDFITRVSSSSVQDMLSRLGDGDFGLFSNAFFAGGW